MSTFPFRSARRCFASALLLGTLARGQIVYTGNNSGADTWGIDNNWSTSSVPTSGDTVDFGSFFSNAPNIDANNYSVSQINFTGDSAVAIGGSGTLTVTSGVAVTYSGFLNPPTHSIDANLALGGSSAPTFSIGSGSGLNLTGIVSGTHGLTKSGDGTLTLSGANTYSGTTTINGGTLVANTTGPSFALNGAVVINSGGVLQQTGSLSLGTSTAVTVNSGGQLNLGSGSTKISSVALAGGSVTGSGTASRLVTNGITTSDSTSSTWGTTLALGASAGAANTTINTGTGSTLTIQGEISDGALVKTGSGTLTLSSLNTYAGGTTINGGKVVLNNGSTSGGNTVLGSGGVTINGGTLAATATASLTGHTFTIGSSGATFEAASTGMQIGAVSGTGGLTKTGSNTLTLNAANTYSGSTTVSAGTLALGESGALPASSALTIANGATFQTASSASIGSITGSGNIALEAGTTLTTGGAGTSTTFSGNITGSSGANLTKTGAGTLTLSGLVRHAGDTTVNAGTLVLSGSLGNQFGSTTSGNITVSGGTLDLGGTGKTTSGTVTISSGTLSNGLLNGAAFVVQSGAASAVFSGSGPLTKNGGGTFTLSGANTYSGSTYVYGGTLALSGSGTLGSTTAAVILNGGTLDLGGTSQTTGTVTFNGGTLSNGTLFGTSYSALSGTASAALGGSGALTKTTSGTLTLTGANTYSGGTTVSAGTLAGNATSLQGAIVNNAAVTFDQATAGTYAGVMSGSGALTKTGSGTLTLSGANTYSGGTTVSTGTLAGNATSLQGAIVNNAAVTFNQSTAGTYAGVMSGSGALTKTGTGTLTLSGANTYAGGTTVSGGLLEISANARLGSGALALGGGGIKFGAAFSDLRAYTVGAGGGTLDTNGFDVTHSAIVSGSGALTKAGTGTLTLAGANTFSGGVTLSAGTLALGSAGALGSSGTISFGGGTLQFSASNTTDYSGRFSTAASQSYALDTNGQDVTLATPLTSSSGTLTKTGSGTLTLSGANTYTGGTTVSAGTLAIGNGGTTGSIAGDITGSGTLTFNRTNAYTHTGNITGLAITQAGSGPVTVTGNVTSSTFDVTGTGGLTLGNVTSSGDLTKTGTGNLTFTGALSASNASIFQISGAGSQVLFDTGSSATLGAILLGANTTLRFAADNVFTGTTLIGNGSSVLGTTLDLNGTAQTIRGGTSEFSVVRSILLGTGGALTVTAPTSHGYLGAISGAGSVTKTGSFPATIVSASPYTGPTTITAGTLNFARRDALNGGDTSLWTAANFTVASGATAGFSVGGSTGFTASDLAILTSLGTSTGGFRDGATLALDTGFDSASSFTLPTSLTNPNGGANTLYLTKLGNGLVTLSGANSYTGTTTVTTGTLHFATRDSLYGGNMSTALSKLSMGGNGTIGFNVGGPGEFTAADMSTLFPALTAYAMRFDTTNAAGGVFTLSQTFSPSYLNFTKAGPGTLIVTQPFNGHIVTISEGTLQLSAGMLGASGLSEINNAGTLVFDFTFSDSVGPPINGTGSVVKNGSGTLGLASTSFTGGLTLNAGTLLASANNQLGAPSGSITFGGGTLRATTGFSSNRPTTLATGGGTFNVVSGQTLTWDGAITGAAGNHLTKTGAGTLLLGGANTYFGDTVVNAGTLRLGAASAFSPNTKLIVAPGATFDANGFTPTFAGLTSAPSGTDTFAGIIAGSGDLTMNGTGTLVLGNANTFTGATTISSGMLQLGAVGALPSGTPVNLSNGATLHLNGYAAALGKLEGAGNIVNGGANLTVAQSANSTFSGAISGTGGLAKSGAGTLTLTGTNTFSGATSITGGAIKLNGSAANSAFTLSGGTLTGNATVGALTISSGGILSPGNSPGTANAGNTTFADGGSFQFEINDATGSAGTSYDLLAISGSLTINATSGNPFTLDLTSLTLANTAGLTANFDSAADYSFTFITTTGGITGFSADKFAISTTNFTNPFSGTWSVAQSGNNLTLNYAGVSAIPEPSTYAAIFGAGALAVALWRRRRRA